MVIEEAEEGNKESEIVEGAYRVDAVDGVAEGIRLTMDRLGKIQMPPWLRERLSVTGGAELLVSVRVMKRYDRFRAFLEDTEVDKRFVEVEKGE